MPARRRIPFRTGFMVQDRQCATCIYNPDSTFDIKQLEAEVSDGHGGFRLHRACHHASDRAGVCCRGFWDRHKDHFPAGQIAQRLGFVQFVHVDRFCKEG